MILILDPRDFNNNKNVNSINLEVYEKIFHKELTKITVKAKQKWELIESLIIKLVII